MAQAPPPIEPPGYEADKRAGSMRSLEASAEGARCPRLGGA